MELLNADEISFIAKQCGFSTVLKWSIQEFEDKILGYLGDHLNLVIEVELNDVKSKLTLFVKCMPRFDKWKADYLKETIFFKKEYVMLTKIFQEFECPEDLRKWSPKLLYAKENMFVFEKVSVQGYEMPHNQKTLNFEELKACIVTLACFHAQSYIYEEKKSKELKRPYRIWEEYSDYLQESVKGMDWRNTGRNAVIDFLKVFSKYKSEPNFTKSLETLVPELYDKAFELMKPSSEYRNVIAHRDLWSNNIFLKKTNSSYHALLIDFQTVIYSSPMLDLSSLIYFNTTRINRSTWTEELIDIYYNTLSKELETNGVKIGDIFDESTIKKAYEKGILFGITQACLITPVIAMSKDKREQIFCDPESYRRATVVSRSKEIIDIAKEDTDYRTRVTELLDELVEKFVILKISEVNCK